jgi:hypothetical protein
MYGIYNRPERAKAFAPNILFIKNLRIREFFLHANELTRIRRKRRELLQGNRKLLAISSQILINSHSRKEKFSNSQILDKKTRQTYLHS